MNTFKKEAPKTAFSFNEAHFIKGVIGDTSVVYDGNKQVAFVGRSNVGKSSVINALLGKKIAKSSSRPGKTRELNFYFVRDGLYFVDLPGYGYARIHIKEAEKIRKRMIWYLSSEEIRPLYVFLVVDARIGLTRLDKEMLEILEEEKHPIRIVLNKIDKIKKSQLSKAHEEAARAAHIKKEDVFLFSSVTKSGREELLKELFNEEL